VEVFRKEQGIGSLADLGRYLIQEARTTLTAATAVTILTILAVLAVLAVLTVLAIPTISI
jgi:hypothetical protein